MILLSSKKSLYESRQFIATKSPGSFKGIDATGSQAKYRSTDYISFFLHAISVLIVPLLEDNTTKVALQGLIRAITILYQPAITESELNISGRYVQLFTLVCQKKKGILCSIYLQ